MKEKLTKNKIRHRDSWEKYLRKFDIAVFFQIHPSYVYWDLEIRNALIFNLS